MRKLIVYVSMLFVVAMAVVAVSAAPADFSGTWKLDASKSQLPQGPGGGGGAPEITLEVKQDAKTLTVVRKTARGEQSSSYNLEGGETTSESRMGKSTHKAKWMMEGKMLEINTTTNGEVQGQAFTATGVAHWELTDGGKGLKIHTKRTTPRGEQESTEVYVKQ